MISNKIMAAFYLIAISLFAYFRWLTFGILFQGDWSFAYKESLNLITPSIWSYNNLGTFNLTSFRAPLDFLNNSLATYLSLPYEIIDKALYLWPLIILLPLSIYVLLNELLKKKSAAIVGSIVFSYSTYFLAIHTQGHELITLSTCFCLLGFFIFVRFLNKKIPPIASILIIASFLMLGGIYDFRIVYEFCWVFVFYWVLFIFTSKEKIQYKTATFFASALIVILLFILNLYWILPNFFADSLINNSITSRSLFGNQYWSLSYALTLMHPFWTGLRPIWFATQSIPFYFWIIPILSVVGLLVSKRGLVSVFAGIIGVIGILLTKQADVPFPQIYLWLYNHLPGFNAFREATKFYILIALAYSILIGQFVIWVENTKTTKFTKLIVMFGISFLFLINIYPQITGDIKTMYVERKIPIGQLVYKKYLQNRNGVYKTLDIPTTSKWTFFNFKQPRTGLAELNTVASNLLKQNKLEEEDGLIYLLESPFSKAIFSISGIRYINIPVQDINNDYDIFSAYGGTKNPNIRQWYINKLNAITWLKKINVGTDEVEVYENEDYKPHIMSLASFYAFDSFDNLDKKYNFLNSQGTKSFLFTVRRAGTSLRPLVEMSDPFEHLRPDDISSGAIAGSATSTPEKDTTFTIFKNLQGNALASTIGGTSTVSYTDPGISAINIVPNGSFESGSWQERVSDCHNYDDNPVLAVSLNKEENTDGAQSLQLEATRHTACVSERIAVKGGGHYLLSFDYQSPNAKSASYYVGFNDTDKTVVKEDLPIDGAEWQSFSKVLDIPAGATQLSFFIYANATDGQTNIINRYDNVSLIEIPDIVGAYYLVSEPDAQLQQPASTTFELINPTKKLVHIKGATTPFFLSMSESYHDKWYLELNNAKVQGRLGGWWPFAKPDRVPDEYHYQLNGFLNAWYVDTTQLCEVQKLAGCTKNPDGSYDIEMVIEFWPQRWFYLGLIISGATLAGCLGYLGYAGAGYVRRKYRLRIRK